MFKKLKEIYKIYGYYHFKVWALHIFVLLSLLLVDIKYLGYALCLHVFYMPLLQLITHDYISHEYIEPKNRWLDLVFLLMFYTNERTVQGKRDFHVAHHRYWINNPDKDPALQKMRNIPIWRYVLALQQPVTHDKIESVKNTLLKNNRWVVLFEPHYRKIYWAYTLIMFLVLPLPWFVALCIYLPWLLTVIPNFHDQVFHGTIQSKDHGWYLPLFSSQAWHLKHHEDYQTHYHGTKFWKWLNIAWYYHLLFFKPSRHNPQ